MNRGSISSWIEKFGPCSIATALAATAYLREWLLMVPKDFSILLQATINVAAIAVGFLATAKGILISSDEREIVKRLKEAHQLSPLIDYFMNATFWCMALCITSAWLLVTEIKPGPVVPRTLTVLWISILGGSGAACIRVIYIFNRILKSMARP